MDIPRLKLFVQVAELGSLTKTARLNGSVQSSISRHIRALEGEYGGHLFYRTGHGVVLTELGERIFVRVKSWLTETEQLQNELKAAAGVPVGVVRLGVLPVLANPLLNRLFTTVNERYPRIKLHVLEGSTKQLDRWLSDGEADIVVLFREARRKISGEITLAVVDMHLIGAAGDPVTRGPVVRFEQLAKLPLVLSAMHSVLRATMEQHAKRKGIELSVVMETDALSIRKDLVADNGCYTVLMYSAVADEVKSGRLQAARIVNPGMVRSITLATSPQRPPTLAIQEVTKLIRELTEIQVETLQRRR